MKNWTSSHVWTALWSLLVIAADQATKLWIQSAFQLHESVSVIPHFFSITYIHNPGAAFGVLRGHPGGLALLAGVTLVCLVAFAPFFQGPNRWTKLGWILLVGGIAGNLADRIRIGSVIDFLDFYAGIHRWPAFNIADSAICIGVACYLVDSFIRKERKLE